jgi:hypothetical protein
MRTLRKFLLYLVVVTTVFVALSLGFIDLLLQPAATMLAQKSQAPISPRIAAFYEREKEAAEYARRTAERDQAEAKPLPPLPKPRVAHKPKVEVQMSAAKRKQRALESPELRQALGYASQRHPVFTPQDRHGN